MKAKTKPIYLGLVRVDHAALVRGWVEGEEICEIAGLGPVPVSVARTLLGDALLYLVLTKGTAVANVVNLKRGPTRAQRVALLWQSPACVIDGCTVIHVDIDHTRAWAATLQTVLADLEHMCDHHHDLKSHHGWDVIETEDGRRVIVPPDDPRHPNHTDPQRRHGHDAA